MELSTAAWHWHGYSHNIDKESEIAIIGSESVREYVYV